MPNWFQIQVTPATSPLQTHFHCSIIGQTIDIPHIDETIDIAHIDQPIGISHIGSYNTHVGWPMLFELSVSCARLPNINHNQFGTSPALQFPNAQTNAQNQCHSLY